MKRAPTFVAAALSLQVLSLPALGNESAAPTVGRRDTMEFRLVEGRSAVGLTRWIQASGPITRDTPRDFATLAEQHAVEGLTVVLDSGGGDTRSAHALGRAFRRAGVDTMVGRTVTSIGSLPETATLTTTTAECSSSCADAFLGGRRRVLATGARLRLHQQSRATSPGGGYRSETAAIEDLQAAQLALARIAVYYQEMGVDVRMMQLAAAYPHRSGETHEVTPEELVELGIGEPLEVPQVDATPLSWSIGMRPDRPMIYRLASRSTSDDRVDGEIEIACEPDGIRAATRLTVARAPAEQTRSFARFRVNVATEAPGFTAPPGESWPILAGVAVRLSLPVTPELLAEAAASRRLSIETDAFGVIDLSDGLGDVLPSLLSLCQAQREAASR